MMIIMIVAMIYGNDFAENASWNCAEPTCAKFANERQVPRRRDTARSIRRRNVPNRHPLLRRSEIGEWNAVFMT